MTSAQFSALLDALDPAATDLPDTVRHLIELSKTASGIDSAKYCGAVRKLLAHDRPDIRALALRLIAELWPVDKPDAHSLVLHYTRDMDAGVRTAALETLCQQNRTEYSFALDFLEDESDRVKLAAMSLFYQRTRALCDDDYCFEVLAPLCNSNAPAVISHTIRTLGRLHPSVELFADACGLSSNTKSPLYAILQRHLESDSSQTRLEALKCMETLSLALVERDSEGVEDTIYRLAKLLLEAVNDEFLEVRKAVFKLLTSIAPYFELSKKPDMESCLFNLADSDGSLRGVLYEFFTQVQVRKSPLLTLLLDALVSTLTKYPEDKEDILPVAAALGRHHASFATLILERYMLKDKRFLSSESNWNEAGYVVRMVFLFNATENKQEIPAIYQKHLAYLSDMYPDYFQLVEGEGRGSEDGSSFAIRYRALCMACDQVVRAPHAFVLRAETAAVRLLSDSCELQFGFTVLIT